MNRYVADPVWHGYILWYFYLGGIAAGAYTVASLAALFGTDADRRATRAAYYLAFPLVSVCGILLIVDLGRPERFFHMLIQSNTWRPMLKWYSPMSAGSWGLTIFGAFSFVSFLGVLAEDSRLGFGRWSSLAMTLRQGWFATLFQAAGSIAGFFLAAYTGALLSATNQPIWADTTWLSPLFLASAISTGIAAILLAGPWIVATDDEASVHHLEWLDRFAILLELAMIAAMAASLGRHAKFAFSLWPGVLIPTFVVPVGLVAPLILQPLLGRRARYLPAALILLGGFALRFAVIGMPEPLLMAGH